MAAVAVAPCSDEHAMAEQPAHWLSCAKVLVVPTAVLVQSVLVVPTAALVQSGLPLRCCCHWVAEGDVLRVAPGRT